MGVVVGRRRVCSNSLSTHHMTCSVLFENLVALLCAQCVLLDSLHLLFPTYMPGCKEKCPHPIVGWFEGSGRDAASVNHVPRFHSDDWNLTTESLVLWIQHCLFPLLVFTVISSHASGTCDFINTEAKILKFIQATMSLRILPFGRLLWYFHSLTLKEVNKPDTIHSRS